MLPVHGAHWAVRSVTEDLACVALEMELSMQKQCLAHVIIAGTFYPPAEPPQQYYEIGSVIILILQRR